LSGPKARIKYGALRAEARIPYHATIEN